MNLPEISVKRPISVTIIWISLIVLAFYSLQKIPVDFLPNIEVPFITVVATYPGAGPEQMERFVAKPLEKTIGVVDGVDEMNTTCDDGVVSIAVRFKMGRNLDAAATDVKERVEFAKRLLPENVKEIYVLKFSTSAFPILFLGITGDRGGESLRRILDNDIVPKISRVPGVGGVIVFGGTERSVNVWLDVSRMKKYGISVDRLKSAFLQYNIDSSVGNITLGKTTTPLVVKGQFTSVQDIENLPVALADSVPVKLKDIADVDLSYKGKTSGTYMLGKPSVLFLVQKKPGANTIDVSKGIKEEIKKIVEKLPDDVSVGVVLDFSTFIEDSIANLRQTLFYGILSVILVSFLFIRRIRESIIIGFAIPTSIFFSVLFLYLLGRTFNIITLSAIIMSSGMVVDNSIVVLESIRRMMEEGKTKIEASIKGANYVFTSILGATATTLIVFLPVIFLKGIAFSFFWELGLVIILSIGISLIVAITLIPSLSSKVLPEVALRRVTAGLEEKYKKILGFVVKRPGRITAGFVLIFISSLFLFKIIKKDFMPYEDTGEVRMQIYLPRTADWRWSEKVASEVRERVRKELGDKILWDYIQYGETRMGKTARFGRHRHEAGNLITLGLKVKDISTFETITKVKSLLADIPDIERVTGFSGNPVNLFLLGQGKPVEIRLFGDDYLELFKTAKELKDQLSTLGFLRDVELEALEPTPEVDLHLSEVAQNIGISPYYLSQVLEMFVLGVDIGTFKYRGDDIKIFLRTKEGEDMDIKNILSLPIVLGAPTSIEVSVGDIANLETGFSPMSIERIDGKRVVKVSADTYEPVITVAEKIKDFVKRFNFPPGIDWDFAGSIKEGKSAFTSIFQIIGVVLFLDFAAMVVTMESLTLPFIILFSIPFAVTGVFISLFVTGVPFSLMPLIGLILLAGLVVNNGIVLLDSIRKLELEGNDWRYAVLYGAGRRLRPVLMTTLTTMFGLFPSLFGRGAGFGTGKPLSISVIGGLFVSTCVTLILIPSIYSILRKIQTRGIRMTT